MILSDRDILTHLNAGNIHISPFNEEQLQENSYDVRLGPTLGTYKAAQLDCKREHQLSTWNIPEEGHMLVPGLGVLGTTLEEIGVPETSQKPLTPFLEGTSGVGRLFITPHVAASFGCFGFAKTWTLELTCVEPVYIYAGQIIAQVVFMEMTSFPRKKTRTRNYANQVGPTPSALWRSFNKK